MYRIIAKRTIIAFWTKYPDSEQYLKTWYENVKNSTWKNPNDVKQSYSMVSILKDSRIVFNIKGNTYRLVAKFYFDKKVIYIRFVGTHQEYDRINADIV